MSSKTQTCLWVGVFAIALGVAVYFSRRCYRKLAGAISAWRPPSHLKKETDYRKEVAGFLRTTLPGYAIIEEYGNERSRADLVICSSAEGAGGSSEKFVIELKYRLGNKAEVDRVIGQCVGYRQFGYDKVILLLIDSEPNMVEVLRARAAVDVLADFLVLVEVRKTSVIAEPIASTANCEAV